MLWATARLNYTGSMDFQRFIKRAYKELDDPEADSFDAGYVVQQASNYARQHGAGDLAVRPDAIGRYEGQAYYPPDLAKSVLGKMLRWCRDKPDGPYTVEQAAKLLSLSRTQVYDLCREGGLACQRHGRTIRITQEQLDEYLQRSQRQPVKSTGFRHL